jgi:hypothetical protein
MNVAILWDIALCSPNVNRRFGGVYHLHIHGRKSAKREISVQRVARQDSTGFFRGRFSSVSG